MITAKEISSLYRYDESTTLTQIQNWINHWYKQLPLDKQSDICKRLHSGKHMQFTSACFELIVFAIFNRMGTEIELESKPSSISDKNLDFLVRCNDGSNVYVDATICGLKNNTQDAKRKIEKALQEYDLHSDLCIFQITEADNLLSKKFISKPFIDLLNRTTADSVRESFCLNSRLACQPECIKAELQYNDWIVRGVLHPKRPGTNGTVYFTETNWCDTDRIAKRAKNSLRIKVKQGKVVPENEIFIVAISICHDDYDWDDEIELSLLKDLHPRIDGILLVGDVALRRWWQPRARLFPNPRSSRYKYIPKCFAHLEQDHLLIELTGFPLDN